MTRRGDLPYVTVTRKRLASGGVALYYRYRRHGATVKLPGDPANDAQAAALYWKLRRGETEPVRVTTIANLIASYRLSPRFTELSQAAQRDYGRALDYLTEKAGQVDARRMERKHIAEMQAAAAETPRTANFRVQVASVLFEHAIDIGWRKDNPAKGVRRLKGTVPHPPWPRPLVERFRAEADGPELMAFELALSTGQRIGDVLKIRWQDIENGAIRILQGKTGHEVYAPITPQLQALLDRTPRGLGTIVAQRNGKPYPYRTITRRAEAVRARIGAESYSWHGLRKVAAIEIYELTASEDVVGDLMGHATKEMVRHYAAKADRRKVLTEAQRRRT